VTRAAHADWSAGGVIVGTSDHAIAKIRELRESSGGFAGIVTAMQDYAQHKAEKGEPVPDLLDQPITRVRP
jgi:hypothetical protein